MKDNRAAKAYQSKPRYHCIPILSSHLECVAWGVASVGGRRPQSGGAHTR